MSNRPVFVWEADVAFAQRQVIRLSWLPLCSRCAANRCHKCLDMGWDMADHVPVTCGCSCTTGVALSRALCVLN
jgi:hypothetical protein